jgi:hypothetical protein
MIGDIIALIELVINRSEKIKESRKEFFNDFVEPAYSQFKSVHEDYLKSFQRYRELIKHSNEPLSLEHKVIAEIRQDHINTRNIRQELLNVSEVIDNQFQGDYFEKYRQKSRKSQSEPEFGFADAVLKYLLLGTNSNENLLDGEEMYPGNAPRLNAVKNLRGIFSKEWDEKTKIKESIAKLNDVLENIQAEYDTVNKQYLKLKTYLLS